MSRQLTDVAVIGAGPYGLSVAAHLRHRGVGVSVFGSPMKFWRQMPTTLNLKSLAFATTIDVPHANFTFPEYCRRQGLEDFEPCSMESFASYGLSLQQALVPGVQDVEVTGVGAAHPSGFELMLKNGERCRAKRVVVAVGLSHFAHMPEALGHLSPLLASHSSTHTDFSRFRGKEVAVLGAGASALETAALAHEAGAKVLLFARGPEVVFHSARFDRRRSLRDRIRHPNSVFGPGRKSWALENFPSALHYLPEASRVRFTRAYLGPAGPWWMHDRFQGKVTVRTHSNVVRAEPSGDRVRLMVRKDGQRDCTLEFDHVIVGTGFQVDVDRLAFLDPALRTRVQRVDRAPRLSRHFESSVDGIYFLGAAAAFSFGPLLRFVAGTRFAAPTVAKHIAAHTQRSWLPI